MNRIHSLLRIVFLFTGLQFLASCENSDEISYEDPGELNLTEYTFTPEKPTSRDETSLIFYGCSYYQTISVISDANRFEIKKRFNSQLKWPCVADYDTISLGKLKKGEYKVTLSIIDVNPAVSDSLFYTESKILTITNK